MTDEIAVLINPNAGWGRGQKVGEAVVGGLRAAGVRMRAFVSPEEGQGATFAADAVAQGCHALVVCGGDGLVHTALQVVAQTSVPLAVVPAGAGNDFARALGLPLNDIPGAIATVLGGPDAFD